MIKVEKRGKDIIVTLSNGHSAALEKIVADYKLRGEEEAIRFILSVVSEADGKGINNGKGDWVPSDNLVKKSPVWTWLANNPTTT